jgi:TetR/AcrR family transcriptional regulator, regulator of autoinduction and epiphytic fitness
VDAVQLIDGRTARRNRNRDAVLDAMITLTRESHDEPPVELIAERAGVSYRSVYRYFEDRNELMLAAIGRVMGEVWPIFDIEQLGEGELDERIERFITSRLAAYGELAPLTRLAVRRSITEPAVMAEFDNVRSFLQGQLQTQFAPELDHLESSDRDLVVAALDVVFQFEALEFLSRYEGMTDEGMANVLSRHVHVHLGAAAAESTN